MDSPLQTVSFQRLAQHEPQPGSACQHQFPDMLYKRAGGGHPCPACGRLQPARPVPPADPCPTTQAPARVAADEYGMFQISLPASWRLRLDHRTPPPLRQRPRLRRHPRRGRRPLQPPEVRPGPGHLDADARGPLPLPRRVGRHQARHSCGTRPTAPTPASHTTPPPDPAGPDGRVPSVEAPKARCCRPGRSPATCDGCRACPQPTAPRGWELPFQRGGSSQPRFQRLPGGPSS